MPNEGSYRLDRPSETSGRSRNEPWHRSCSGAASAAKRAGRRRPQPQPEADRRNPPPKPERSTIGGQSEQVRSPAHERMKTCNRTRTGPTKAATDRRAIVLLLFDKPAASIDDAVAEIGTAATSSDSSETRCGPCAPRRGGPSLGPLPAAPPVSAGAQLLHCTACTCTSSASAVPRPRPDRTNSARACPVSAPAFSSAPEPMIDLANLDQQLYDITERIEVLPPSN